MNPTPTPADREAARKAYDGDLFMWVPDNDMNRVVLLMSAHFAAHAHAARMAERERCARALESTELTPEQRKNIRRIHWPDEQGDVIPCDVDWGIGYALGVIGPAAIRKEQTDAE